MSRFAALAMALAAVAVSSPVSASGRRISLDRREYVRPSLGNLTDEAKALLARYAEQGKERKPVFSAPKMIVRGQCRYGNDREDFIHAWYERPLHQDSSWVETREKGHFINLDSWKADVALMKESKYDAFAFFPKNSGCMDVFDRSVRPGGEFPIVPQFCDWHMRPPEGFAEHVAFAERLLKMPNALRFKDRVVIPFFGPVGWWQKASLERMRRLRTVLAEKHGAETFAVIPWFQIFKDADLNGARMTAKTLEEARAGLCSALRDFDGMFYSLLDTNWMPYECSGIPNDTIMIPLLRSIFAEPEFRDKYLGVEWYTGHQNTYRRITDCSCLGMERQRIAMESFLKLQPDFTWASEWDEANENDHLQPTVSNGRSVTRMVRHYVDLMAGREQTPLPDDDVSIPNLVLAYRKAVVLGEYVEAQVVSIPDGTAAGDFTVSFRWLSGDGRTVKAFPARKLSATRCRQETFAVSSVDIADARVLYPELTVVDAKGVKKVYADGFWPMGIEGTRTLDAYWVKHALRDVCRGVTGSLSIGPREADGTFVVSGSVAGPRKFRSIEVLENSDSVYMYDAANARPKAGVDLAISFKSLGPSLYSRKWPQCTVRLVTSGGVTDGDCRPTRDFKDIRFFVPDAEVASASVEIDLPAEKFSRKIPVADIVRDEARSFALPHGGQAVVRRAYGTHRIPRPAMTDKAEFAFRMKPLDPTANLRLQVVDEDYRIWRGSLASFYRPSGKTAEIHVFDEETDGVRAVTVDRARLYALKYDLAQKRTDDMIYPIGGRRDSPCVFGGSISLVTGVGYGHEDCWYQHALAAVNPGINVAELGRFASLPLQFNPWRAGYKISIRVRPADLSGCQYLLDSWHVGFKLRLENGVPVAYLNDGNRLWHEGVNMAVGPKLTGLPLKAGEWSTIEVVKDQRTVRLVTNGVAGEDVPLCSVEANPHTMTLGCSTAGKDFFRGEFGELSVAPR